MRNLHIDATKGVLIFLVVLGHYLERLIGWNEPLNQAIFREYLLCSYARFYFYIGNIFKEENPRKVNLLFIVIFTVSAFISIA